jgi:hypothetical protein
MILIPAIRISKHGDRRHNEIGHRLAIDAIS